MRRLFKFFGWTLLTLTLLVIVSLGIIFVFTGTDTGFAHLSNQIDQRVDTVQLDNMSGNLGHGLSAGSMTYANDTVSVNAEGVSSAWQLKCLLKRRVCFDELIIDRLDITTLASTETAPVREGAVDLPAINLPVNLSIDNVVVKELHYKAGPDSPEHVLSNIRLAASTRGTTLQIIDISAQYGQFSAALNGTVELVDDYPVGLSLIVGAADIVPDTVAGGEGQQSLIASTQLSDSLTNLTINTAFAGAVRATLTAVVHPLEKKLPLTATLISKSIGWPLSDQSELLASDTRLELEGDTDDFRFSLQTQLSGQQIPSAGIQIDGLANAQRVTIPRFAIDTLNGHARGTLLVSPGETTHWDTLWNLENIDPAVHFDNLPGTLGGRISASGQLKEGQWSLRLEQATIEGEIKNYPLLLDARLSKGLNDVWFVERLRLNNEQNQIDAEGVVDDQWNLHADINLPRLENLLPGLAGGFSSEITMDGELAQPGIRIDAAANQIQYSDTTVQGMRFNANIDQLFHEDSQLDLTIDAIKKGETAITSTAVSLAGSRDEHALNVSAKGPDDSAITVNLTGSLQDNLDWKGVLDGTSLNLPGHLITLSQPAELGWLQDAKLFSVNAHCWNSEASSLCLENDLVSDLSTQDKTTQDKTTQAKTTQAKIALKDYQLQRLNPWLPQNLRLGGTLSANTLLSQGADQPGNRQAIVEARIDQGSAQVTDGSGNTIEFDYEELSANSTLDPTSITGDLNLTSDDLGKAQVSMQLDPTDPETALLDKAIQGELELTDMQVAIAQVLLPDFDEVSGTLGAKGSISGTLSAPLFNGAITLNDPVLKSELLPLPVTGGQIVASFTGQNLIVDGELLSDEGAVAIEGAGSIKPDQWYAKARLIGDGLALSIDPVQESIVNPDITISVNPKVISVRGNVKIPMAVIDVEELPEGAKTISDDVVIVEDQVDAPITQERAIDTDITVQLNVSLGDEVQLSAYGLSARLEGDMDILLRSPKPPQFGGEISVVDGIYKQYGQDLTAEGQILFVGPVNNTRLDIDAVREIGQENRTAGVHIQGTVAKPEITLFTNPADKSQDAILSYVVLGRDINEASDQDANLLAAAALALTVRGSRNVAGDIASALGVQDFALETKGSGDNTELLVSGRLNDKLLLRYGRGVFDAQNTLYLRYDLTRKLYLEAAQGAVERAVDLFYSFSF